MNIKMHIDLKKNIMCHMRELSFTTCDSLQFQNMKNAARKD